MPPAPYLISGAFDSLRPESLELHVPVSGDAIQVDPLRANHGIYAETMLGVHIAKGEEDSVTVSLGQLATFTIDYITPERTHAPVLSKPVTSIRFSRILPDGWSVDFTHEQGSESPEVLSQIGLRTFMNLIMSYSASRQRRSFGNS